MPMSPKGRQKPTPARQRQFYSSHQWTRHSKRMRQEFPICMAPFCKHRGLSTSVHHIIPYLLRPDLGLSDDNTCPVCEACHHYVEGLTKRGQPTAHMFAGWREQER